MTKQKHEPEYILGWKVISRERFEEMQDRIPWEYVKTGGKVRGYRLYWSNRLGGIYVKEPRK